MAVMSQLLHEYSAMHEYVVRALEPMSGAEREQLAEETGQSKWTIQKVRIGQIKRPSIEILQPLYDRLKGGKKRRAA